MSLHFPKKKCKCFGRAPSHLSIRPEILLAIPPIASAKFLYITVCFVVLCATSCNNTARSFTVNGDEVHFQKHTVKKVSVNIANPRKVGRHHFKTADAGIAGQRESPSDIEIWNQSVTLYVFIKIRECDTPHLAVYPKRYGRFGRFGQVYEEWRDFSPEERLTAENSWIELPFDESIAHYIFVLRSDSETTGWRVAVLEPSEVTRGYEIRDLLTLPKLTDDENQTRFRKSLKAYDVELD